MIATTTVKGTDVTISIEQQGRRFIVTQASPSGLVNYIRTGRDTEDDARSAANWLWAKATKRRDLRTAGTDLPRPIMAPVPVMGLDAKCKPAPARKPTNPTRIGDADFQNVAVPAGRYALDCGDDLIKFFRVTHGKGSWLGKIFLQEQAGPAFHKIASPARRLEIMTAIHADPKAAMLLYGIKKGYCGKCGLELTKKESRDAGIGPICAGKLGW
jgi:hypothetical protein